VFAVLALIGLIPVAMFLRHLPHTR